MEETLKQWIRRALLIGTPIALALYLYNDVKGRQPAPEVSANFTDGDLVELGGPRPHPLVLYFWERKCEDKCRSIQDTLNEQADDWEVVGIAVQEGEPSVVEGHHRKNRLRYRSVHDQYREIFAAYGCSDIPTVIFIDKQGKLAAQDHGRVTMLHLHFYYWLASL